jgi:hypothetical protein
VSPTWNTAAALSSTRMLPSVDVTIVFPRKRELVAQIARKGLLRDGFVAQESSAEIGLGATSENVSLERRLCG